MSSALHALQLPGAKGHPQSGAWMAADISSWSNVIKRAKAENAIAAHPEQHERDADSLVRA